MKWIIVMESDDGKVFVYQLRVRLREISPEIWRRILIRSDSTIADLHYTLTHCPGTTLSSDQMGIIIIMAQ
jgi:hypothetical protein